MVALLLLLCVGACVCVFVTLTKSVSDHKFATNEALWHQIARYYIVLTVTSSEENKYHRMVPAEWA